MAQTKREIQELLAQAGGRPRHRFGQNFMIDGNLVRLVADSAELRRGDAVIEVGPGTGTLTQELLARCDQVIAVEIDRDLASLIRSKFSSDPHFKLIEGDALAGKHALNDELYQVIHANRSHSRAVKLVANLPYNIASPLVIEMLLAGVERLTFTVQKEVAWRLRAPPGSGDYGPLSVMAQMLSRVQVLRTIPPQAFWPEPKIESALMQLDRDDRLKEKVPQFGTFVHRLFMFRRKTLRKALVQAGFDAETVLQQTSLDGRLRPEMFAPEQLLALALAAGESDSPSDSNLDAESGFQAASNLRADSDLREDSNLGDSNIPGPSDLPGDRIAAGDENQ
jgi:16S rRNA (adenine1518-N6/adenine1519-N6)-dimethyltransferase